MPGEREAANRGARRDDGEGERVSPAADRVRVLLGAALWPLLTAYAAIASVLAIVTVLADETRFSTEVALLGAGPAWLAAYQVPLTIDGQQLALLPLLATLAVCWLVARAAGGAAARLAYTTPQQSLTVIGAVAGAHALLGLTIAVLSNGATATAEPLAAFWFPALLGGLAATAGVARQCELATAVRDYVDEAAVVGLRAGALGLAGLIAAGSVVLALSTILSAPTMYTLFDSRTTGFGSGLGLLLLSIVYLPNAVLFGLAFVTGPGFGFGQVEVGPFGFTGGEVPGVPLLAAIPVEYAEWWRVLFVLPFAVGALVGWTVRRCDPSPIVRLRVVAVAGALVGFGCVVLGGLAGGQLGAGPFRAVAIPVGLVSLAAFCWIVLPGGLVAWFGGERPVAATEEADGVEAEGVEAEGADAAQQDGAEEVNAEDADTSEPDAEPDVAEQDSDQQEDIEQAVPEPDAGDAEPAVPETSAAEPAETPTAEPALESTER